MLQPPTLVSLTNIPTPYRTHLYNALANAMRERDLGLHVMYMAQTEPGRYWTFDKDASRYHYTFLPGWHILFRGYEFHFNPSFLTAMWKNPPRWLLVSGSWFFPTVQAVPLAAGKDTITLFWNESNLAYMEQRSRPIDMLRRRTLDYYDGFVVPGAWARDYVHQFAPSSLNKPFLKLPNIVNESLFRDQVASLRQQRTNLRRKWGCDSPGKTVLLTIARIEPIKGVRELVESLLNFKDIQNLILLIAGTGALQNELEARIRAAGLEEHIRFVGYQSEENILELLALSDAFVLPSLGDPYPLVVIEAEFAGLPVLLSDRVGCHPEALVEGENGLLFDPYNPASITQALQTFLDADPAMRTGMGAASLAIAESIFSTRQVVPHFIEELLKL
jgi:glycosyltransferase involved in cell wall biosynthesis